MKTIVEFLQAHGLLRRPLLRAGDEVGESFCFRKSDLTEEGFEFIKKYYDKWSNGHDRGKPITDTSNLKRWLIEMRRNQNTAEE